MKIFVKMMCLLAICASGCLLGMKEFKEKWDTASIGKDIETRQLTVLQSFDLDKMLQGKDFKNKSDAQNLKDIFEFALNDAEKKTIENNDREAWIDAVKTMYDSILNKDFKHKFMFSEFKERVKALKTKVDVEKEKKLEEEVKWLENELKGSEEFLKKKELDELLKKQEEEQKLEKKKLEELEFAKKLKEDEEKKRLEAEKIKEDEEKLFQQELKKEQEKAEKEAEKTLNKFAEGLQSIALQV